MLSTATIILGGIPAAIYERFAGIKDDSTPTSLWIWLAGTAVLTLPAMGNFLKFGLKPPRGSIVAASGSSILPRGKIVQPHGLRSAEVPCHGTDASRRL